jgi:hypothetical protein
MSNTAATPAEITEFPVCADCAIVLVNGDASGIEDAETHLAAMDEYLSGVRNVIVIGQADRGFCTDTCGACGTYTATDDWYDATAELLG